MAEKRDSFNRKWLHAGSYFNTSPEAATRGEDGQDVGVAPAGGPGGRRRPRGAAEAVAAGGGGEAEAGC